MVRNLIATSKGPWEELANLFPPIADSCFYNGHYSIVVGANVYSTNCNKRWKCVRLVYFRISLLLRVIYKW